MAATPSGARAVPPQGARRSSHALGRVGGASTGLVAGTGVGTSCPDRSCSALCSRAAPCLQLAGSGTKKHLWTMAIALEATGGLPGLTVIALEATGGTGDSLLEKKFVLRLTAVEAQVK